MTGIRVTVARASGSVPRGPGTSMMVFADRTDGTIGGGALEWAAMAEARAMLAEGAVRAERVMPLGPALGQCCGGSVSLLFERAASHVVAGAPVWIWGAGHVGRALVGVLAPLDAVSLTWVDVAADRFGPVPPGVARMVAADMALAARYAPDDARHLIVTYSHDIDLALCHALLSRRSGEIGLIGSATKWARFRTRLRTLGHTDAEISRIRCPIGQKTLGKHPQAIAVGVAAEILAPATTARRRAG